MKKIISFAAVLALLGTACALPVSADEAAVDVTVTIANTGKLEVVNEPVTVTDTDGDGALTISDALYLIHEAKYDGGAAAGYATSVTQWGLGISKLWGNENSGSFGYTVNNAFANGLADTVSAGDAIYAYTYTDAAGYSDTYSYFDTASIETETGKEVTLTLKALAFNGTGMSEQPVADAAITFNGETTNYMTENDGTVKITFAEPGDFVISAVKEGTILVPPAATAKVTGDSTVQPEPAQTDAPPAEQPGSSVGTGNVPAPQAGERAPIAVCVTALAMLGAAAAVRRKHEK